MKQLTREDSQQIMELMKDKEFTMTNNRGTEVTVITERDVNDILGDMRYSPSMAPKVELSEDNKVTVTYPHNICTLVQL